MLILVQNYKLGEREEKDIPTLSEVEIRQKSYGSSMKKLQTKIKQGEKGINVYYSSPESTPLPSGSISVDPCYSDRDRDNRALAYLSYELGSSELFGPKDSLSVTRWKLPPEVRECDKSQVEEAAIEAAFRRSLALGLGGRILFSAEMFSHYEVPPIRTLISLGSKTYRGRCLFGKLGEKLMRNILNYRDNPEQRTHLKVAIETDKIFADFKEQVEERLQRKDLTFTDLMEEWIDDDLFHDRDKEALAQFKTDLEIINSGKIEIFHVRLSEEAIEHLKKRWGIDQEIVAEKTAEPVTEQKQTAKPGSLERNTDPQPESSGSVRTSTSQVELSSLQADDPQSLANASYGLGNWPAGSCLPTTPALPATHYLSQTESMLPTPSGLSVQLTDASPSAQRGLEHHSIPPALEPLAALESIAGATVDVSTSQNRINGTTGCLLENEFKSFLAAQKENSALKNLNSESSKEFVTWCISYYPEPKELQINEELLKEFVFFQEHGKNFSILPEEKTAHASSASTDPESGIEDLLQPQVFDHPTRLFASSPQDTSLTRADDAINTQGLLPTVARNVISVGNVAYCRL